MPLRVAVDVNLDDDALELAYLLPGADGGESLHGYAPAPRADLASSSRAAGELKRLCVDRAASRLAHRIRRRQSMRVTFCFPAPDLPRLAALDPDRDWTRFQHGEEAWVLATYLRLRAAGAPVELAATPPTRVVVVHGKHERRARANRRLRRARVAMVGGERAELASRRRLRDRAERPFGRLEPPLPHAALAAAGPAAARPGAR